MGTFRIRTNEQVCARKQIYCTRSQARKAAKRASRRAGQSIRWYECEVCGYYHLTSRRRDTVRVYEIRSLGLRWER